jgi:hypothetical protein
MILGDKPLISEVILSHYALQIIVFTLNRVPTKCVERTPYEIWTRKHLGLSFLKVRGFETYVKYLMSDKLTPKSDKHLLVGYPRETIIFL